MALTHAHLADAVREAVQCEAEARRALREARAALAEACRSAREENLPLTQLARTVLQARGEAPTPEARRRVAGQLRQLRRRAVTARHADIGPVLDERGRVMADESKGTTTDTAMQKLIRKTVTQYEFLDDGDAPANDDILDESPDTDEEEDEGESLEDEEKPAARRSSLGARRSR